MNKVDWELINDYEFVYLAADLLRRLGFIDVNVQGDGPDGGIDLLATELVHFAVPGPQPFRWGVQCKFSTSGEQRAVSDNDVKDVEGVLRSDRFHAQDLRGYMLITNRRVSQNVVERLAGINRRSHFRTCYIDGTRLQHLLSDNSIITEKYFNEGKQAVRNLGAPIVVPIVHEINLVETINNAGTNVREQYLFPPSINVGVSIANQRHEPIGVKALLDTGADVSIISPEIIKTLEQSSGASLPITRKIKFYSESIEEMNFVPCFNINIKILDTTFDNVEVVALNNWFMEHHGLWLGWSFLKDLTILLDGKELLRLWKRKE